MKKIVFSTVFLLITSLAQAETLNCDVFKSEAAQEGKASSVFGNAFAVAPNLIVINEHSLGLQDSMVKLTNLSGKVIQAKILIRDFHTDLALLGTQNAVNPCSLEVLNASNDAVTVIGFDREDTSISTALATVKNDNSRLLAIPGVRTGIELTGANFRQSQSGSVLMQNSAVVGMLAQKTDSGNGLAIPRQVIHSFVKNYQKGNTLSRPYKVDKKNGFIDFQGLRFTAEDQRQAIEKLNGKSVPTGGNPHEGLSGNPHEGRKQNILGVQDITSISLEVLNVGFAVHE